MIWTLCTLGGFAATHPRAHYAEGQLWVIWSNDSTSWPETFGVYLSAGPFTNTSQAVLIGRPFADEVAARTLKREIPPAFGSSLMTGWRIPVPGGGTYMLATNEAVFAATVRASGAAYMGVVPYGQASVAADDLTTAAVSFTFTTNDPPRPHLQIRQNHVNPLGTFPTSFFAVWADGDQDDTAGRPDFPILSNAAKRGAPHTFMMVEPRGGLSGGGPWPAALCLHDAGGAATDWLPTQQGPLAINALPTSGPILAFDDDEYRVMLGTNAPPFTTDHFGYARGYDPFTNTPLPAGSTVVNYTQRRYLYVLDWLIGAFNLDLNRISVLGHGDGAEGAMMLGRAFPERFSVVELYNCPMSLPGDPLSALFLGTAGDNFGTSLTNHLGHQVHMLGLTSFATRLSAARDLPLFRHYAGKCDNQNGASWRPEMLEQMRWSDHTAAGLHFYWDLKSHGFGDWRDHWVDATSVSSLLKQTQRDDVGNQARYRNDRSFPAFFNLQQYPGHGDPGNGGLGGMATACPACCPNPGNGDDHGTWGGYFDWQTGGITDTATNWACTLFLVSTNSGYALVDASPYPMLRADVAIRRPQNFRPPAGSLVDWQLQLASGGQVLQQGHALVGEDDLVSVTNLPISRDPLHARLVVSLPPPAVLALSNAPGGTFVRWQGNSAYSSQVEHAHNLADEWAQLDLPSAESDALLSLQIPPYLLGDDRHFFRLMRRPLIPSPIPAATGFYTNQTFVHGGIARNYFLQVPVGWNAGTNWPLVLLLPGHGQSIAKLAALLPEFRGRCFTNGVILVFAEATAGLDSYKWFASEDPHLTQPYVDDAGFLLAFMDTLKASGLNVNSNRCYLAGFSNGGSMVHFMASRTNHPFAAFAIMESGTAQVTHYREPYNRLDPDAGSYVVADTPLPAASRPVFLMNMTTSFPWVHEGRPPIRGSRENVSRWTFVNGHGAPVTNGALGIIEPPVALLSTVSNWTATGTARARIAYGDMRPDYNWPSNLLHSGWAITNVIHFHYSTLDGTNPVDQHLPAWIAANYPHVISPDPVDPHGFVRVDAGTMKVEIWRPSPTNRTDEVIFITLSDGGHQWPEAADKLPFNASLEVLNFFNAH